MTSEDAVLSTFSAFTGTFSAASSSLPQPARTKKYRFQIYKSFTQVISLPSNIRTLKLWFKCLITKTKIFALNSSCIKAYLKLIRKSTSNLLSDVLSAIPSYEILNLK